jgi:putative protease
LVPFPGAAIKPISATSASLAILISAPQQLPLVAESEAQLFFQLANGLSADGADLLKMFRQYPRLSPWFPALLIGRHYDAAVDLLERLRPQLIVTDNSGIAFKACQLGIPWIAGPGLNTVNSYSLLCLKEEFHAAGAFISNEISRRQLEKIVSPPGFTLYYSLYHPIQLMTSRPCLHLQIDGCEKSSVDEDCLQHCARSSTLTNMKKGQLVVEKSAGCYQRVFNDRNYLNTAVVNDLPQLFGGYLIDLSGVKTATRVGLETIPLIRLFERLLEGDAEAGLLLEQHIQPTTGAQYAKGI